MSKSDPRSLLQKAFNWCPSREVGSEFHSFAEDFKVGARY